MAEGTDEDEEKVRHPPVNGIEYPEKPEDATATEMMEYMDAVDRYWQAVGLADIGLSPGKDPDPDDTDS